MATRFTDELQSEAPPSKRVRLEHSEDMQGTTVDMTEDDYCTTANEPWVEASKAPHIEIPKTVAAESSAFNIKGIPGLGLLEQAPKHEQRPASGGKAA
jgi:hypothetical protein